MDKFEQMMKDVKGTSHGQLDQDMEKYKGMCICPKCPTHTTCAKDAKERVFCLVGKSFMCISEQKACICPTCPLTPELGLKNRIETLCSFHERANESIRSTATNAMRSMC